MTEVIQPITVQELDHLIDLQSRAYRALIWLSRLAGSRPDLITERTADDLRDAVSCQTWIDRHVEQLPREMRPLDGEREAFAHLFSAFFQSSFRVQQRGSGTGRSYAIEVHHTNVARRRKQPFRKGVKLGQQRRAERCRSLERRALMELADLAECETGLWADACEMVLDRHDLRDDVLLWTYATLLIERARGSQPHPTEHVLWKELVASGQKKLVAAKVMHARDRLSDAVRENHDRLVRSLGG